MLAECGSKFIGKLKHSLKLKPGNKRKVGSMKPSPGRGLWSGNGVPVLTVLCVVRILSYSSAKTRSSCYSLGCKLWVGWAFLGIAFL